MSPARQSDAGSTAAVPSPSASPSKDVIAPLRKQLQQAIADKVVLVRALHKRTGEMAEARAEAKKFQAMSERSLSTAWRLGQLGQLGLALLETGDDDEQLDQQAIGYSDGGGSTSRGLSMQVSEPDLDRRWEALLSARIDVERRRGGTTHRARHCAPEPPLPSARAPSFSTSSARVVATPAAAFCKDDLRTADGDYYM